MFEVKVIADSIGKETGKRITTFQLKYPRYIHAEVMTHRVFSRNASSSRAIPVSKLAQRSIEEMVLPIKWGLNQAGMQSQDQELKGIKLFLAKSIWVGMAHINSWGVRALGALGLHKQWANRPLEWFGNIEVVLTSTEWDNFYELRAHRDAQPEIQHLANMMLEAQKFSQPVERSYLGTDIVGKYHLPYITEEERGLFDVNTLLEMSTARCARVSYLTHDKLLPEVKQDIALYERLVGGVPIHASPTEHQACVLGDADEYSGNFRGWYQFRKTVESKFKK